jgi:ABC-type glycerol-3-phosphate transport system permease component
MPYLLSLFAPQCGLHDLFEHHGSHASAPDPQVDAFVVTVLIIFVSAVVVLLFCCPFLAIRVRRIRDLFWVIPSVNLALYLLSIALRAYPGGFIARFRAPGLWFTLMEVFLVLVLSLLVASLNACAMWMVQKLRAQRPEPAAAPKGGPVAPPVG